jgi:hypothetical protein
MSNLTAPSDVPPASLGADTLAGAAAIGAFIAKNKRQTEWLLERGALPAFKIGRIWHMRRSAYLEMIETQERAAMARALGKAA